MTNNNHLKTNLNIKNIFKHTALIYCLLTGALVMSSKNTYANKNNEFSNPKYTTNQELKSALYQFRNSNITGDNTEGTYELFEKIAKKYPDDVIVKLYLGLSYGIEARESWFPPSKDKYVTKAFKVFDKILISPPAKSQPGYGSLAYIEVNALIGIFYTALPEFIYKKRFEGYKLLNKTVEDSNFQKSNDEFKANVYYGYAQNFHNSDKNTKAKKYANLALSLTQQKTFKEKINDFIKSL